MTTKIIQIDNIFAVQNSDGSFVGFASTQKKAEEIKAKADANTAAVAELLKQGYSLNW
jgi:hypothetical protein